MLVITRRLEEEICIGPDIRVVLLSTKGGSARIGVIAPKDVLVLRKELTDVSHPPTDNRPIDSK